MSVSRRRFTEAIAAASTPEERIVWFGALLGQDTGRAVEIVGGSAIEIYLSSAEYISQGVDLVGQKLALAATLRRWGFREVQGRSQRTYWFLEAIGLVDLVGPKDRSGVPPTRLESRHGPVWISAVEPLIVHRLTRAARESGDRLFTQAVALARGRDLDWEYLEVIARFEGCEALLRKLRARVGTETHGYGACTS